MAIFGNFFGQKKKPVISVKKVKTVKHAKAKHKAVKHKLKHKAKHKIAKKHNINKKISAKKIKVLRNKALKSRALKIEKFKKLKEKKLKKLMEKKIKREKKEKEEREREEKKQREEKEAKEKEKKEREEKLKRVKEEEFRKEKEKKRILEKPIEAKKSEVKKGSKELKYIKTYVPGFDSLLKEGIPVGSSVLIEGGPGSGKTLFCLTLLAEMCKKGKKILYMSFEEPEARLRDHIRSFGVNPEEMEKKGLLYIKRFNALDIARSVEALLSEAKKELLIDVQPVLIPGDFHADVVLIDSLTSISSAFSGESSRFRIYMEQLFRYLESHQITSFLIREVANPAHVGGTFVEEGEAVSFLSDGIVVLYNVFYKNGTRKRAIEVLKMRGAEINRKVVECEITKKGVIVKPNNLVVGNYRLT